MIFIVVSSLWTKREYASEKRAVQTMISCGKSAPRNLKIVLSVGIVTVIDEIHCLLETGITYAGILNFRLYGLLRKVFSNSFSHVENRDDDKQPMKLWFLIINQARKTLKTLD